MRPIASLLSPISPMTMSGGRGPRQAPTMEELVVAFGGIKDVSVGLRSSERIWAQRLADATQFERAVHMAQLRDSPGTLSKSRLSILNIPNDEIIARASRLGISLGESPSAITASVNLVKETEYDRSLVILQKNLSTLEDDPKKLLVSKVSGLCEDLLEEDALTKQDHTDLNSFVAKVKCNRGKKKDLLKLVSDEARDLKNLASETK